MQEDLQEEVRRWLRLKMQRKQLRAFCAEHGLGYSGIRAFVNRATVNISLPTGAFLARVMIAERLNDS